MSCLSSGTDRTKREWTETHQYGIRRLPPRWWRVSRRAPSPAPAAPEADKKAPYPPAASLPTQAGPLGIRFDLNQGARLVLPNRPKGKWRVRLRDLDTGNLLFQSENHGAFVSSSKRFFVRFSVEAWELDAAGTPTSVLAHEYDARDRDVLIQFPIGTLGDILAWFSYAARFGEVHGCRLTCPMSGLIIPLLRDAYPAIRFVNHEALAEQDRASLAYAIYCLGLVFGDAGGSHQPTDFRHVGQREGLSGEHRGYAGGRAEHRAGGGGRRRTGRPKRTDGASEGLDGVAVALGVNRTNHWPTVTERVCQPTNVLAFTVENWLLTPTQEPAVTVCTSQPAGGVAWIVVGSEAAATFRFRLRGGLRMNVASEQFTAAWIAVAATLITFGVCCGRRHDTPSGYVP